MKDEGMMLSRVAEHLYWAGRQLMRAEDVSRAVLAYNAASLTAVRGKSGAEYKNLLAALGQPNKNAASEEEALRHLITSRDNVNSVRSCAAMARENMRVARAMLPEEIWAQITHLCDTVESAARKRGRQHRARELRDIILQCRAIVGVLLTSLRRGAARGFLNIGILLECAEMDCRLLRYALPEDEQEEEGADSVRWRHLMDAFGLTNMYRAGSELSVIRRDSAVDFIVADTLVPRSLMFCINQLQALLSSLPNNAKALEECARAAKAARAVRGAGGDAADKLERAQNQTAKLHAAIVRAYFSS